MVSLKLHFHRSQAVRERVKDREIVEKIKAFTVTALPNADLVIGERV
jgi:hypothetical protein